MRLQRLEQQVHKQEAEQTDGQQNQSLQTAIQPLYGPTNSETAMSAELPVHDDALPEGAASLLAITSTADISKNTEASAMTLCFCSILFVNASQSPTLTTTYKSLELMLYHHHHMFLCQWC